MESESDEEAKIDMDNFMGGKWSLNSTDGKKLIDFGTVGDKTDPWWARHSTPGAPLNFDDKDSNSGDELFG